MPASIYFGTWLHYDETTKTLRAWVNTDLQILTTNASYRNHKICGIATSQFIMVTKILIVVYLHIIKRYKIVMTHVSKIYMLTILQQLLGWFFPTFLYWMQDWFSVLLIVLYKNSQTMERNKTSKTLCYPLLLFISQLGNIFQGTEKKSEWKINKKMQFLINISLQGSYVRQ